MSFKYRLSKKTRKALNSPHSSSSPSTKSKYHFERAIGAGLLGEGIKSNVSVSQKHFTPK